jgi:8-oxo-dGTP pyrophosphatase MutT (NUDIX family)
MEQMPAKIAAAIARGLPGTDVQWEMASSDRMIRDFPKVKREDSKMAAVLILLYPEHNHICTLLMQRPVYNGVHSGQISFPGGRAEPGDGSLVETALREAAEETGIVRESVSLLGLLTPLFIPVSDTEVTPVVGWSSIMPSFRINESEVVHIIEVRLSDLSDPLIIREKPFLIRNEMITVKYYDYNGNIIWGATAMLLHELMTIFRRDQVPFTL